MGGKVRLRAVTSGSPPSRPMKALAALLERSEEWEIAPPPRGWELAQGKDVVDRVARQGRTVLDYAKKMAAMGIIEKSLAGKNHPTVHHVQAIGQARMRLVPVDPSPGISKYKTKKVGWRSVADDAWGPVDADEDDDPVTLRARDHVRDWETVHWSIDEVEAACGTLLTECYSSQGHRQATAIEMLLVLTRKHEVAQKWMARSLEAIVNDGLPSLVRGSVDPRIFRICYLIAGLAPSQAGHLGRLNAIPRMIRLMNFEQDLAARLIQSKYLMARRREATRHLPSDIGCRRRVMIMIQNSELVRSWRTMQGNAERGDIPHVARHEYIRTLLAMVQPQNAAEWNLHLSRIVANGGLFPISRHLKPFDRTLNLSLRILVPLATDRLLLYDILKAGVTGRLSKLLEWTVDRLLDDYTVKILDVIDALALSATQYSDVNSKVAAKAAQAALPATAMSENVLERLPQEMEPLILDQLGNTRMLSAVVRLLVEENAVIFMGALVVLTKLAHTVCYSSVLREVLAMGGWGLDRLVQGIQSGESMIAEVSLALLLQLCSRPEGRESLCSREAVGMLLPLCSGNPKLPRESSHFLLGLTCLVALSRQGVWHTVAPPYSMAAARGFSKRSDLASRLYLSLMSALGKNARKFSRKLIATGALDPLILFLCGSDDQSHYFDIDPLEGAAGSIVLHGLIVHTDACASLFQLPCLHYLCLAVQNGYNILVDNGYADTNDVPVELIVKSVELSCRALAYLATSQSSDALAARGIGCLRFVVDGLISTSALNEVGCMIVIPRGAMEERHVRSYVAMAKMAAILAGSICPIPADERDAQQQFEEPENVEESIARVVPLIQCLTRSVGTPLCAALDVVDCMDILTSCCDALAKLSATPLTAGSLIKEHGFLTTLLRLAPRDAGGGEESAAHGRLCQLPASYFTCLGNISRVEQGRAAILGDGLLRRALERLRMLSEVPNQRVEAEIFRLLTRVRKFYSADLGSTAIDLTLAPRYHTMDFVVERLRTPFLGDSRASYLAKYHAAALLAALTDDISRVVPDLMQMQGVGVLCRILEDTNVPMCTLQQCIRVIHNIASHPDASCIRQLRACGVHNALAHISLRGCSRTPVMSTGGRRQSQARPFEDTCEQARAAAFLLSRGKDVQKAEVASPDPPSVEPPAEAATEASVPALESSYLKCGTQTCGSLGNLGDHGAAQEPMPPFVQYPGGATQKQVPHTPFAILSAREGAFRAELQRRRHAYHPSTTSPMHQRKPGVRTLKGKGHKQRFSIRSSSTKLPVVLIDSKDSALLAATRPCCSRPDRESIVDKNTADNGYLLDPCFSAENPVADKGLYASMEQAPLRDIISSAFHGGTR